VLDAWSFVDLKCMNTAEVFLSLITELGIVCELACLHRLTPYGSHILDSTIKVINSLYGNLFIVLFYFHDISFFIVTIE
jgi:hypothetical protein